MAGQFKPNIYPIIWWAIAYGLAAGILLWLVSILSQFITTVWFPVFLAGLIWGGWRNYKKQKGAFEASAGVAPTPQSPVEEFKEAVADIATASQELMQQQPEEPVAPEEAAAEAPAAESSELTPEEEAALKELKQEPPASEPKPPTPPSAPQPPQPPSPPTG